MDLNDAVKDLEERAERLLCSLEFAQRAFVVEFAGTPKSGKSTSVEAIRHFFHRLGFRVHVLTERASVCPIPMKGHLFFNTWCATSMLSQLLENVETETDIVIADRGLFDALIWFRLQNRRGELSQEELTKIENFLLMDRWKDLFDLIVVLSANPEIALDRENANRLTERPGSVMNVGVLDSLCEAVDESTELYSDRFRRVFSHKTDDHRGVRESNIDVLRCILDEFEEFVDPEIMVVEKASILPLLEQSTSDFTEAGRKRVVALLEDNLKFVRRADAESDPDLVQIVSCGVLVYQRCPFLFERHEKNPKSSLYGRSTIWQGCHVPRMGAVRVDELAQRALRKRIADSLFISRSIHTRYVGYAWDTSTERGKQHLGLMHVVNIESSDLAESWKRKQFRKSRGHGLTGDFIEVDTLRDSQSDIDLEPWSVSLLPNLTELLR